MDEATYLGPRNSHNNHELRHRVIFSDLVLCLFQFLNIETSEGTENSF